MQQQRPDRELEAWALRGMNGIKLEPQHVAPERPREGLIVYADGTNWNPGAGKGVYVFNGSTWNILS